MGRFSRWLQRLLGLDRQTQVPCEASTDDTLISDFRFIPRHGSITAEVFVNEVAGIPKSLFFRIDLKMPTFDEDGETQEPTVTLECIRFPVTNLQDLEGMGFSFPVNPVDGYIDGSLYLYHVHNPFDVTRIDFGKINEGFIESEITGEIDFAFEGPVEWGRIPINWSIGLKIDEQGVDAAFKEARRAGILS